MAALLIALSIMSIMLAVAMPAWKQMAQREKEAELIFRGQQYARAIGLFQRRAGPGALPPNLDVLIQQRFLRKKYKDPITGDDFVLLRAGQAIPGSSAPGGTPPQGRGASPPVQPGQVSGGPGGAAGGIQGVVSKSKAKSLRLFNGRDTYSEWTFVFVPQVQAPAGPGGVPGGRGGPAGRGGIGGPFGTGAGTGPGGRATQPGGRGAGGPSGPGGAQLPPGRAFPPPSVPPPSAPGRGGSGNSFPPGD